MSTGIGTCSTRAASGAIAASHYRPTARTSARARASLHLWGFDRGRAAGSHTISTGTGTDTGAGVSIRVRRNTFHGSRSDTTGTSTGTGAAVRRRCLGSRTRA